MNMTGKDNRGKSDEQTGETNKGKSHESEAVKHAQPECEGDIDNNQTVNRQQTEKYPDATQKGLPHESKIHLTLPNLLTKYSLQEKDTVQVKDDQRALQGPSKRSLTREPKIRNLCAQEMERRFPKIAPMPQLHCKNKALKKDFDLGKACITTILSSRKMPNKQKALETVDKMFDMSRINRAIFMRQLGILPEEDAQYIMGHTNLGDRISDYPYYISRAVMRHISLPTLPPTARQTTGVRGQPKTGRGTSAWALPNEPTLLFLQPDLTIRPRKKCRQPVPRDPHTKPQRPNWNTNRPQPPILSDTVCQEPTRSAVRAPSVEDARIMADIAKAACSKHDE